MPPRIRVGCVAMSALHVMAVFEKLTIYNTGWSETKRWSVVRSDEREMRCGGLFIGVPVTASAVVKEPAGGTNGPMPPPGDIFRAL